MNVEQKSGQVADQEYQNVSHHDGREVALHAVVTVVMVDVVVGVDSSVTVVDDHSTRKLSCCYCCCRCCCCCCCCCCCFIRFDRNGCCDGQGRTVNRPRRGRDVVQVVVVVAAVVAHRLGNGGPVE